MGRIDPCGLSLQRAVEKQVPVPTMRFRFSLRCMFALIGAFGVAIGLFSNWYLPKAKQRRAVESIRDAGGDVYYDWHGSREPTVPAPAFIRLLFGKEFIGRPLVADLAGRRFVVPVVRELRDLPDLEEIDLAFANLRDEDLRGIARLRRLSVLNLGQTGVTDAGLAHLRSIRGLRELRLSGTRVTVAGLAHLASLSTLEKLALGETPVTLADTRILAKATRLKFLTFDTERAAPGVIEALRRDNPGCRLNVWGRYKRK